MRTPILALAAAALVGCAPRTAWVKTGATAEDLRSDREACARGASGYDIVDRGARAGGTQGVQADLYRACMESRGWRRERGPAS